MAKTRATSSLDLHLDLTGSRVRTSLEAALREAARGGRLLPGTRLPSSRALATDLGIARNTVADAYGQLVAEGWLAARHGSGTWVAERTGAAPAGHPAPAAVQARQARYNLRTGVPDVSAFPRSAWLAAARKALLAAPSRALSYGDPRGLPQLRTALAGYLSRARGVAVTPDRVIVCGGFAQGLELLCEALRARGARALAVEEYGHERHWRIARREGLALKALPVDGGGAVLSDLGGAQAVLLTPTHQFPLGLSLSPARRRRVADWAASTGGVIIEDDYDGELRYDRPAVGALQALAPERVVYAGTASKSLAPGLRLGWLVLPAHLVDDVAEVKNAAGRLSSSLDQLTLAELIESGGYDRQVRRVRLAYRRRRDRLVAVLRREAPQVRVTGIAAGLHAVLRLPPGQREEDLVARAARHGLAVEGLGAYSMGRHHEGPALVVGYATPPAHAYTTALARLCAVLASGELRPGRRDRRRRPSAAHDVGAGDRGLACAMTYGDIDVVADCGADPTWRTYSDGAFADAVSAAQPGQTIGVPPGMYKTSRPIIAPPYVGWAGSPGTVLVGTWAERGSVIKPGPDWAQGDCPLNAVIALLDQTICGYPTRSEEQHFNHLMLSGAALPAGQTVHGIASLDQVSRVQLREVHIGRMTGDGIHQEYPHDPYVQPGGWTGFHVFSRYNAGHGYLLRSADSNWTKCLATNSGQDGWHLDTTGNTEYLGCRSEWSGQSGYRYSCRNNEIASGGVAFTGCRTDRSAGNGFLATGGVAIPLAVTGCTFKRDAANDHTAYAGIRIRRFAGPVTITGCQVFPGRGDDGSGALTPYQAIRVTGGSRAVLAGCYLHGHRRAWHADASSSVVYDRTTTWASGPTSGPVTVAGP